MLQRAITRCNSRSRDTGKHKAYIGHESNGGGIVSENDLLVNKKWGYCVFEFK